MRKPIKRKELSPQPGLKRRTFLKAAGLAVLGPSITPKVSALCAISRLKNPTLEEKIGSLLLIGFRGLRLEPEQSIADDLLHRSIGGVVLFDTDVPTSSPVRNIESPEQLKSLVSSLQGLAACPLIVAVDHEGGRITRLKENFGFPKTSSALTLGRKNDLEFTFSQAEEMACQLARVGINLNLAPVVDLNTNPENPVIGKLERSFSGDSEVVILHAERFIEAHHKQGIMCTLKHFPGHGSSVEDSHLGLVDISSTWEREELKPYEMLINKGMADAVMTAHVFNKHLDPDYPATLSKRVITGILRDELNYNGIVISDDLQMGAITKNFGIEEAIYLSIEAGVDMLAFANNSVFDAHIADKAIEIIKRLISTEKISVSRIDESFTRIERLRAKLKEQAAA